MIVLPLALMSVSVSLFFWCWFFCVFCFLCFFKEASGYRLKKYSVEYISSQLKCRRPRLPPSFFQRLNEEDWRSVARDILVWMLSDLLFPICPLLSLSSSPAFRKHILSLVFLAEHPACFPLEAYPEGMNVCSALQRLRYPRGSAWPISVQLGWPPAVAKADLWAVRFPA